MKSALSILLFFVCGIWIAPPLSWSQSVSIRDGLISVDLRDTPLVSVAGDIERLSGISFKGDDSLVEERVSVAFKDLPLEQGIKRILATLNYSFLFDSRGEISEVVIMSEGSAPAASEPQIRRAPVRRAPPAPARQRPVIRRPGATTPFVGSQQATPAPVRPRTIPPRGSPQRPVPRAPAAPQAPADPNVPGPFRAIESEPPAGGGEDPDGPLHPAFRVMEREAPPTTRVIPPGQIPRPPAAEGEDKPGEEAASKEEAGSPPQQN